MERTARDALGGGVSILLGEGLALPAAVVLLVFLTRTLGPDGYGVFALAGVVVLWLKQASLAFLSKATIAAVGAEPDPRPAAGAALRVQLAIDAAAVAAVWATAGPLARVLGEPELVWPLRVFALELPLAGLMRVQCDVLVGLGRFRRAAAVAGAYWTLRVVFVVPLVAAGLAVVGAAAGSVLAAGAAALACRPGLGARVLLARGWPLRRLASTGVPLLLMAMAMVVVARADLVAVTVIGGSTAAAGRFAAAQGIASVLGVVSVAMGPVLLSTLARLAAAGEVEETRATATAALRVLVLLTPLVALAAAAAPALVDLALGPAYAGSAAVLSVLLFAVLALVVQTVCVAMLTAAGRAGLSLRLSGPAPLAAVAGHALLVPRFGALGAAAVTLAVTLTVAALHVAAVRRVWSASLPWASAARALVVAAAVAGVARRWPASGGLLLLELAALAAGVLLVYAGLGELGRGELRLVAGLLPGRRFAGAAPAPTEPR